VCAAATLDRTQHDSYLCSRPAHLFDSDDCCGLGGRLQEQRAVNACRKLLLLLLLLLLSQSILRSCISVSLPVFGRLADVVTRLDRDVLGGHAALKLTWRLHVLQSTLSILSRRCVDSCGSWEGNCVRACVRACVLLQNTGTCLK
jgi:hypothetical protein